MEPKPRGWAPGYATWFDTASVVERYDLRPPYPEEAVELLASLAVDQPRTVLDAGCGPGDIARRLAPHVDRVDAVDRSRLMLAKGSSFAGGDAPNLNWVHGEIEDVALDSRYALVTAGESIHWFDWAVALPRFAGLLSPQGVLALVSRDWHVPAPVRVELAAVYAAHGANPDFAPLNPAAELERRDLFVPLGQHTTQPVPWHPTLDHLIGCHHSQNGFVLERMRDPASFDTALAAILTRGVPYRSGRFELEVTASVTWGRS